MPLFHGEFFQNVKSAHDRDALFAFHYKYVIISLYINSCIRFGGDGLRHGAVRVSLLAPRQKGCGLYQSKARKRRSAKRQTRTQRQLRTESNAPLETGAADAAVFYCSARPAGRGTVAEYLL